VVCGILFFLVWAVVHVILFYSFFISGVIVDILITLIRSICLPGTVINQSSAPLSMNWLGFLVTGLSIAGAAGIPGGLAFFWKSRRRTLWSIFWVALILGALFEIGALYSLVMSISPESA
jgi:hypothetical protein